MKKDKNISQSGGGFTQNSTTVDVSKQNSTGNNHALSLHLTRALDSKDRRIRMPSKVLLALNKARLDLQKQSPQKAGIDGNSVQAVVGKSPTRNRSSQSPVGQRDAWSQRASRLLSKEESLAFLKFHRDNKYDEQHQQYCEMKSVNDLVYNEPTHLVSVFKDFLILDDVNEFLKRPYTHTEQKPRLARLIQFYQRDMMATQIYPGCLDSREFPYPNYAAILPDPGHYVFKNIERRQRLRDQRDYLKRKNEEGEDGDGSKPAGDDDDCNISEKNDQKKKQDKDKLPGKLFDTKFLESVRLHHQNISLDDKSFKFSSEAAEDVARGSMLQYLENQNNNNNQNMVVNQSLLSINQYSSNAMNLKKNQRGEATDSKPYNRNSTRNIEHLIQEFIKRDSIMISEGTEQHTERQRMQAQALGIPTTQTKKGDHRSSSQKKYELRLNTEDGEAIGKQYESMFENQRGSIDTDQSASYTQRSIRVSAIMGDPVVPFPSSTNPFSVVKQSSQLSDLGTKSQKIVPPSDVKKPVERPGPFKNYQMPKQAERPGSMSGALASKNHHNRKQKSKDIAVGEHAQEQRLEIGPITVQVLQPPRNQPRMANVKSTASLAKQTGNVGAKSHVAAEGAGGGALGRKRKSTVAPPSKNETKSLNAIRNRNNLVRSGTGSTLAMTNFQKPAKIQTSSPMNGAGKGEIHRTPTVGSFNPAMNLMTSQKNLIGFNSKSPSGLGPTNSLKPTKTVNARRNSTSLKANRQSKQTANGGKFESHNPRIDPAKVTNYYDKQSDGVIGVMSRVSSQKDSNHRLFFQGITAAQAVTNQRMHTNEAEDKCDYDSDESDDTVKLEDFQEAQNDHYHNDIMNALKSYPKSSLMQSSQLNANSLASHHQLHSSHHSSVAQSLQVPQPRQSQQIVDQVSQSLQSWQPQSQIPNQQPATRSSHNRNAQLELGSNSSGCNFDYFTKNNELPSHVHPFVRAMTSQGQVARASQNNQNSLHSISSQEILIGAQNNTRGNNINESNVVGFPNGKGSAGRPRLQPGEAHEDQHDSRPFTAQSKRNSGARSMQRELMGQVATNQPPHQHFMASQQSDLMPSKTFNPQTLMPIMKSQPQLPAVGTVHDQQQFRTIENGLVDRYKSQTGFDLFNKDMGGANIIPHKKVASMLKSEGPKAAGLNNKGSSPNLQTIPMQKQISNGQLIKSLYMQVQDDVAKESHRNLQTIPSNQDESLSQQILNTHTFQSRSRTRPQSRNYGQKPVVRGSVSGSAAASGQRKLSTQQQSQQQHKNFESRKGSINRIHVTEHLKNNINRISMKSHGNLQNPRMGPNSNINGIQIDSNQIAKMGPMQVPLKSTLSQRRKSHQGKQQQTHGNKLESQMQSIGRQLPSTTQASKSLTNLQKPTSASRTKKASQQQSPNQTKGGSTKLGGAGFGQRAQKRQPQAGHAKQLMGSASLSSKSGPASLAGAMHAQPEFSSSHGGQPTGGALTGSKYTQKKTPQQSPLVNMSNNLLTRNKMRQTQTSIGTIQSLAAVPGSFGLVQDLAAGSSSSNQFSHSKKHFGNTQPLKGLQILSSNYQITQITQGPGDAGNYFMDTNLQTQLESREKSSTVSGSHSKNAGGSHHTLNRNLSPTLNFQMIQRKEQQEQPHDM